MWRDIAHDMKRKANNLGQCNESEMTASGGHDLKFENKQSINVKFHMLCSFRHNNIKLSSRKFTNVINGSRIESSQPRSQ